LIAKPEKANRRTGGRRNFLSCITFTAREQLTHEVKASELLFVLPSSTPPVKVFRDK
jgi:hypothetical protein